MENEASMNNFQQEIMDLQSKIGNEKRRAQSFSDESMVYKKQIENLLEQLQEKSDSESFDDEKERLLNVKKALRADQLEQ